MAIGVEFPVLNSQRFVPLGETMPAQYHFVHFDQDWFVNSLMSWQNKVKPYQLLQLDQRVTVQCHLPSTFSTIELYKVSCSGVQTRIDTDPDVFNSSVDLPGNVYDAHGDITPVQLTTWQWSFITGDIFTESVWYLLVKATISGEVLQFISEPNLVKEDLPNTLLMQYGNPVNDKDIAFSLNPRFEIRVDGYINKLQIGRDTTSFRDEMTDLRQLESHSYRIFDLNIGSVDSPAPEYLIDKVRAIMDLEIIYLDGKRFVMNSDGDFSISDFKYNAVNTLKIPIVEYWPEDAGKFYQPAEIVLFDLGSYPYLVSRLEITGPGGTIILSELVEIFDSTQQTALLNSYSTTITSIYGLTGIFANNGTSFVYRNGPSENYATTKSNVYRPLVMNITTSAPSKTATFSTNGLTGNETVVSVYTSAGASVFGPQRYLTAGPYTISKTFATAGNYKVYIYNNDKMLYWLYGASGGPVTTGMSGQVSQQLNSFRNRFGSYTILDFSFLRRASYNLQSIDFTRGATVSVTTTAWDSLAPGEWMNLSSISFNDNSLTNSAQDDLYNDIYNKVAVLYLTAGTINTSNQSPPSAAGPGSFASRTSLTAKGWTIIP